MVLRSVASRVHESLAYMRTDRTNNRYRRVIVDVYIHRLRQILCRLKLQWRYDSQYVWTVVSG